MTPPALAEIQHRTEAVGFNMGSEPLVGALLRTLVASRPGGRFLELGTGTGIGAAWMLSGMDAASTLVTVDIDPAAQSIANDILGADPRLTIVEQDAIAFLQACPDKFDLVFADALPGKYDDLEYALAVVKPGGFYVIDDLLPQVNWPEGHAARVPPLKAALAANTEFHIVDLQWASGVLIAVRK